MKYWPACLAIVAGCVPSDVSGTGKELPPDAARAPDASGPTQPVKYRRHRAVLAKSGTVQFGGSPYCTYSVTLENVVVDLLFAGNQLITSSVGDTMVEAIVGTCSYAPAAPSRQYFGDKAATTPDTGARLQPTYTGAAANRPTTTLEATLQVDNDAALSGTFVWRRTDGAAPSLNWVVTVGDLAVPVASCTIGSSVCLGDGDGGALYRCENGVDLVEEKSCPRGCPTPGMTPATSCL